MSKKRKRSRKAPDEATKLPRRGIFMMHEVPGNVAWQVPRPLTTDLVKRIAFNCFLCDVELSTAPDAPNGATDEDVFARWLQRRFNVAGQHFPLNDGTERLYSDLLVPACRQCNNVYMSSIEDRIARAITGDFARFAQLRREDLYLWCAKIYYGLIYHQTKLSDWRAGSVPFNPQLPQDRLHELDFLLRVLQGFRKRVMVGGPKKFFSLLTFPLSGSTQDFKPALTKEFPCIALQLGSVGVICVLDDFGTTENVYDEFYATALNGKVLDPMQFWELVARLSYLSWIMPFRFTYSCFEGQHDMMLEYSPESLGECAYDERIQAQWIADLTGSPIDMIYVNGSARSLLLRPDRSFNELTSEDDSPINQHPTQT